MFSETDYNKVETLLDQTVSDNTPVLSLPFEVLGYTKIGVQLAWYGTLVGLWSKIQISNSYVIAPGSALFTPLTDPDDSLVAFMSGSGEGVVNGTPNSAYFEWETAAGAIQLEFTRTGGSGRLWIVATGKR